MKFFTSLALLAPLVAASSKCPTAAMAAVAAQQSDARVFCAVYLATSNSKSPIIGQKAAAVSSACSCVLDAIPTSYITSTTTSTTTRWSKTSTATVTTTATSTTTWTKTKTSVSTTTATSTTTSVSTTTTSVTKTRIIYSSITNYVTVPVTELVTMMMTEFDPVTTTVDACTGGSPTTTTNADDGDAQPTTATWTTIPTEVTTAAPEATQTQ
ncbi:hypothetical protein K461DRAFT_297119 [Myriangium duriaei CBS 260.36]|uniref:Uncharacterized protein n=1 Tax=Myriangium duriaei CBS 260.36 TaxID=1168546 RepID=A0A9P4IXJ1_9PEZI|nr:hypothetical protein K461DRAFT_297119 [Myriangium duriaei CBS 260.36]